MLSPYIAVKPKRSFNTLQVGRGLAVLMVVVAHVGDCFGVQPGLWQRHHLWSLAFMGRCGVDFFFILSGVVIFMAHSNDLSKPSRIRPFLWKRFRRIYPIYWIMLIPTIAIQLFQLTNNVRNPWTVLSNFLLIHVNSVNTILAPSWTLFHEVLFYLLFATFIYRKIVGIAVMGTWLVTSFWFFRSSAMVILPDGYLAFVFSPLHLLFGLGIIVGWVIRKQWVRNNLWIVAGGLSVFMFNTALTIVAHRHETVWLRIAGDVGLAVSIWAAMGIELSRNLKFPSTLKFLGDASYSIYLIHFLVITEFAKELYALDRNLFVPVSAILFLLFSAALLSGIALHMGVEIPLLRLLSRKKHPEEQLDPLAIPVAYPAFGMPE